MNPRSQPAPALCNLLGYKSAHTQSEASEICNLIGYKLEERTVPVAGSSAAAREVHPRVLGGSVAPFGAEVCHLIGDMTLEEDCA